MTALLGILIPLFLSSFALAQDEVNFYVSPQYGLTMSWNDPWYFVGDESEGTVDYLELEDDRTGYVTVSVDQSTYGNAGDLLIAMINSISDGPAFTDLTPWKPADGSAQQSLSDDHAFASYTLTYTNDAGEASDIYLYMDAREYDGFEVASFCSGSASDAVHYHAEFPMLLAGMAASDGTGVSGEPTSPVVEPDDSTRGGDTDIETAQLPPGMEGGEPAPVFVSGPWRMGLVISLVGSVFPELGLELKPDRDWWVEVLDVTNWSPTDETFDLRQLLIQSDEMPEAVDLAPSSTLKVAEVTGYAPATGDKVDIGAGETARLVVVYSIPSAGSNARLSFLNQTLPLESTIVLSMESPRLQEGWVAAEQISGTIASITENAVTIQTGSELVEVELLGVDLPGTNACYGPDAGLAIDAFTGATVEIEDDGVLEGTAGRYLWLVQPDGTRLLLNEQLLATGNARYQPLPTDARFSAWLAAAAAQAQANQEGLWATCAA